MITSVLYGLNGTRMHRFLAAFSKNLPPLDQFANIIGPGRGSSRDALQAMRTAAPMDLIVNETDPVAVVDPSMGYECYLQAPERGAQRQVSKFMIENSMADGDTLVGNALRELGESAGLTFKHLLDYWLADIAWDGNVQAQTGYSGSDGVTFFNDAHPAYKGAVAPDVNDNLMAATDFNATNFANAYKRLMQLRDPKLNPITPGNDILIVAGPLLWDRVTEFVNSGLVGLKPFEASNTAAIVNNGGMKVTSYINPRYTGVKQYYWSIWDREAMTAQNGSGLNVKVMRMPQVYPSQSLDGRTYYYTNTVRVGIGNGTTTFGVGCAGAA